MKIIKADLWEVDGPTVHIVTVNSTLQSNGTLIMGVGAALQARERYHGIALECGKLIGRSLIHFGFILVHKPGDKPGFGIFQVKDWYSEPAKIELITLSTQMLTQCANDMPDVNFRLNYPGIGAGRLTRGDVYPVIQALPDNVTICER